MVNECLSPQMFEMKNDFVVINNILMASSLGFSCLTTWLKTTWALVLTHSSGNDIAGKKWRSKNVTTKRFETVKVLILLVPRHRCMI